MTIPPLAVPFGFRRLLSGMLDHEPPGAGGFAAALADAAGARSVELFPSGRAALSAALTLAARPGRDEVLVPAYTCWTVPASIVRAGLRVRLVDVDPQSLDVDPADLRRVETNRLAAVVATHLFARTSDVAGLAATMAARDPGVRIVEDAAQAWPAATARPPWPVVLSFGRGKPLPLGGGGALLRFGERDAAQPVVRPRSGGWSEAAVLLAVSMLGRPATFGALERIPWLGIGTTVYDPSFDADSSQPAWRDRLGVSVLPLLGGLAAQRTSNAEGLRERVKDLAGWRLTAAAAARGPLRLPLLAPSRETREAALRHFRAAGVAASPMYPGTIAEIPELRPHLVNPDAAIPGARELAARLMTIPIYPGLTPAELARVAKALEGTPA